MPEFIGWEINTPEELEAAEFDAPYDRPRYFFSASDNQIAGVGDAFCGNSDVQVWEQGDRDEIRREVLRKRNAARGGGLIFQSDHSVTSGVSGHTYDAIVGLVRQ